MTSVMEAPVVITWRDRASCRDMDPELFFPEADYLIDPTVMPTCHGCPVREDCLQYALGASEEFGIWGGLTEDQRRFINTTRSRVRCPDCRSDRVAEQPHSEVCLSCGLSWPV